MKLKIFIAAIPYTPVFMFVFVLYAIGWLGYPYALIVYMIFNRTLLSPREYSEVIGKPLADTI